MFYKILNLIKRKKILSVTVLVLILGGVFLFYNRSSNEGGVKYVFSTASTDSLISSVSGIGQVLSTNEIDIKSKVSEEIVWVGVKVGQGVTRGQVILSLDNTDKKRAIADAELDLEESRLNLDKDIAEVPIEYERKLESLQSAKNDLEKEYEEIFNIVADAFLDLPSVVTGVNNVLYGEELSFDGTRWNISILKDLFDKDEGDLIKVLADIAEDDFRTAEALYDQNFVSYKDLTVYSEKDSLEDILGDTLLTAKSITQATKSAINLLDTVVDIAERKDKTLDPEIINFKNNLGGYLGIVSGHVSSLLSQEIFLDDAKQDILNEERDLALLEINNPTGENPIDLQIAQNNIKQKEQDLEELKEDLSDYVVVAPLDGIISEIDILRGDYISSNSTVATMVSNNKFAELTLNEVDLVDVEIGQKANISFDAIDDLSIVGEVSEIDVVGTVSQGVVEYNVKVSFDNQDERIKPGMSVSVSIITEAKSDVLIVSNAGVKQKGEKYYVEVLDDDGSVRSIDVEVGSSNDLFTEIISGINEGAEIIVGQNVVSSDNKNKSAPSLSSGPDQNTRSMMKMMK